MKDCLYLKTNFRMCFYISKQINKCQKNEESLEIDIHKIVLIYITYDVSVLLCFQPSPCIYHTVKNHRYAILNKNMWGIHYRKIDENFFFLLFKDE